MIHTIIVPGAIKGAANLAASQIGVDPEGLMTTLCVPLVPEDGANDVPATHWACCGQIPDASREWLEANVGVFPGAMWWRWDHDGRLLASHDTSDLGAFWSWETCLDRAQLKRRVIDTP